MSRLDDCTLADARSYGFGLLELYKLWRWNCCLPNTPDHAKIDKMVREAQRELDNRYQLLPLDADGEIIHVGDKMFYGDDVFVVCGVGRENGRAAVYYTEEGRYDAYFASVCHHYHKPTVEDLLRRFGAIYGATNIDDLDSLVAKYAETIKGLVDD